MFGKRCTLCGGKLNSEKICTECGLNNTKYESKYILNQSSCDSRPLTHVHDEKESEQPKSSKKYQYEYQPKKQKPVNHKGCFPKIIKWGIILFLFFQFIGIFLSFIMAFF